MIKDVASHTHNGRGTVFTIGHSTRPLSEFIHLLREVQIELLVDVRAVPRSQTNPQFNIDTLRAALAEVGIGYVHLSALGGLRHRRKTATGSPNALWQNTPFRNYADYAWTEAFRMGIEELEVLARACTHKSRLVSRGSSMSALPPESDFRQRIEHVR
jgi:uncharacterized protein (DUF488 family)